MRLFISINLPDKFNDGFRELQRKLDGLVTDGCEGDRRRKPPAPLAWHAGRKSGFHLTLFFLGEVSAEAAAKIGAALAEGIGVSGESVTRFRSFKLKFSSKLGVFKDYSGSVKSVFVDIDKSCDGYESLIGLQKKVAEIVGEFGFKDSRKFSPHITLCRVKNGGENLVNGMEVCEVNADEFGVDAVYLMESHLGSGGSEYGEIASVRLG